MPFPHNSFSVLFFYNLPGTQFSPHEAPPLRDTRIYQEKVIPGMKYPFFLGLRSSLLPSAPVRDSPMFPLAVSEARAHPVPGFIFDESSAPRPNRYIVHGFPA